MKKQLYIKNKNILNQSFNKECRQFKVFLVVFSAQTPFRSLGIHIYI